MPNHHNSRGYRGTSAYSGAHQSFSGSTSEHPSQDSLVDSPMTPRTTRNPTFQTSSHPTQPMNSEETPASNYVFSSRRTTDLSPGYSPRNWTTDYENPQSYQSESASYSTTHSTLSRQSMSPVTPLSSPGDNLVPRPTPSVRPEYRISAADSRTLDPRFRISPSEYFIRGRVFSILWHENDGRGKNGTYLSTTQYKGKFGEPIYSTIRRMVVFKELPNCSWCFSISTYGRQGVAKPGIDPLKHAIIHMNNSLPIRGKNEPSMTKDPLEVAPDRYEETLDPMSRLNFGKIYTVEHNVKVFPIGMITDKSIAKFLNYARSELAV